MGKTLVWTILLLLALLGSGCSAPKEKKKGNDGEVHYILGISYLKEANATLALKEFLLAEKFDPEDADIQAALGQAYQRKLAHAEAERHYLKALELTPGEPRYQNNLADLYLDMQRWDDAIAYFRKAAENLLFSSPEVALTGAGYAHFQKGEYQEAAAAYSEALARRPDFPQARLRLGEAYFALDKTDLAVEQYRLAIAQVPDFTLAHYKLALAYMKLKETEEALESFREVVRLAPKSEAGRMSAEYLKLLR